ncbi:MAG TPA: YceI family protein [Acetobacteraceae bacterium]|nr:YceI family protein [Acetobacteraceae bacterium]
MKRTVLPALLTALLAVPASTCAQVSETHDPGRVESGSYVLEPSHTQVNFVVSHMGFTNYYGRFSNASGTLTINPHDPAHDTLEVTVPVETISTTSDKLNGDLKGADWLDAEVFPTATFKSAGIMAHGGGTAEVAGTLTLHGITRPMVFSVRFNGAGINPLDKKYTVGFEVTGQIKRSDFGISKYVPLVGNQVTLLISAAFERQGS